METRSDTNQPLTVLALPKEAMSAVAAIDFSTFQAINAQEAIPESWEDRARKAWEHYTSISVVANVINTWLDFAVGEDIHLTCEDEKLQEEAQNAYWALGLDMWVRDMIQQMVVKGDCLGYIRLDAKGQAVAEVSCVNPVSAKIEYTDGELSKVTQYAEPLGGGGIGIGEGVELPVEQIIHRKWNSPSFARRGNSMVLPAFEPIEQLRDYRKADRAIAKRWTTPLRFIKVGGKFGDQLIMPDTQMIQGIRDQVSKMDIRSGLVVPFWVTAETYGTEGQVLNTEEKIREIKEDIMVALGLAKSLVTGDGPNFATALVSLRKMLITVKRIRQTARDLLYWVFDRWLTLRGQPDAVLEFVFPDLNLDEKIEAKKLLLELYDRGLVSKKTVQIMMELNPDIEQANREGERVVDRDWSVQDIVQMVQLGILPVQMAQEVLGIDPAKAAEQAGAQAMADIDQLYTRASAGRFSKVCDDCAFFGESNNRCHAQDIEIPFDTPACVLFEQKLIATAENGKPSAASGSPTKGKPTVGDCGCGPKQ